MCQAQLVRRTNSIAVTHQCASKPFNTASAIHHAFQICHFSKLTDAHHFSSDRRRQAASASRQQPLQQPLPALVRSLQCLLSLVTLLTLSAPAGAARPGFTPQPPDTEGREPATLLVTVPASVLLPSLVASTADRAARALHVSTAGWRSLVRIQTDTAVFVV